MQRIRPYLELARISNLPTVWSNALVGLFAGFIAMWISDPWTVAQAFSGEEGGARTPGPGELLGWLMLLGLPMIFALSCFYAAGMVLNDVMDVAVDRQERPARPIPSGRVSPVAGRRFAVLLFILGVFGIAAYGSPLATMLVLLLGLAIVAYNRLHTTGPAGGAWSVVLLGLCRGLVYTSAAALFPTLPGVWMRIVLPFAVLSTLYTILFSLVARQEMAAHPRMPRWVSPMLVMIPLSILLFVQPTTWQAPLVAGLAFVGWTAWSGFHAIQAPPRMGQAVGGWIAGLCLIDAFYLAILGQPLAAAVVGVFFLLTLLGQRSIAGT